MYVLDDMKICIKKKILHDCFACRILDLCKNLGIFNKVQGLDFSGYLITVFLIVTSTKKIRKSDLSRNSSVPGFAHCLFSRPT